MLNSRFVRFVQKLRELCVYIKLKHKGRKGMHKGLYLISNSKGRSIIASPRCIRSNISA